MTPAEIHARVKKAEGTIGAAMTMLWFGKVEQTFELLKDALKELAPIGQPGDMAKASIAAALTLLSFGETETERLPELLTKARQELAAIPIAKAEPTDG